MKKMLALLCAALLPWASWAQDGNVSPRFDHSALKQGSVHEFCSRDPCVVAKILDAKIAPLSVEEEKVEMVTLGGSRAWDAQDATWNKKPDAWAFICSLSRPGYQFPGSEEDVIPLNSEQMPGAYINISRFYLVACHNGLNKKKPEEGFDEFAARLGYGPKTEGMRSVTY